MASAVLTANAQDKNPTKNDPQAKKILDAVSAKFKTYKAPQASFTYKVENAQGKALSSKKGTVIMKGNKYKVSMDGLLIISDGKTVWNYDKSSNEVTVNNVDASGNSETRIAFSPTDLPCPVAPAISRCGMLARSTMKFSLSIFLPMAMGRLWLLCMNFSEESSDVASSLVS